MAITYLPLRYTPGVRWAGLRELRGRDEQAVEGNHTAAAIALLDRLLVTGPGSDLNPGAAASLVAADRDRLLAALYVQQYGSQIESVIRCRHCQEQFDLQFDIETLVDSLNAQAAGEPAADGSNPLNGARFRLPTGEDELAVWRLPSAEVLNQLVSRCVVEGKIDSADLQAAAAAAAPLIDLDLTASCPECGQDQPVHFDVQSYLLAALERDRFQLAFEIHQLARAYGWHLSEILDLTRRDRRAFLALVEWDSPSSPRMTR